MDASNLALVMMPNLMRGFRKEKSNTATIEKFLKLQTAVVKHLIENADDLGMVPDAVLEKLDNFGNRSSDLLDWLTSEDELDKSDEATLEERKKHRRRRRSGPIQGRMGSDLSHKTFKLSKKLSFRIREENPGLQAISILFESHS